jgi:hypothetical protein
MKNGPNPAETEAPAPHFAFSILHSSLAKRQIRGLMGMQNIPGESPFAVVTLPG